MTFADEVVRVALGLMGDPNFAQPATLYVDTSPEDSYGNNTAATHTSSALNGFFIDHPATKVIEAEGTEPIGSATFYTPDVTTTIKLKDYIVYAGNTYEIVYISTPQIANTKMYRILGLELAEAKV